LSPLDFLVENLRFAKGLEGKETFYAQLGVQNSPKTAPWPCYLPVVEMRHPLREEQNGSSYITIAVLIYIEEDQLYKEERKVFPCITGRFRLSRPPVDQHPLINITIDFPCPYAIR